MSLSDYSANIVKAKTNKYKGLKGGDCNITQCQTDGASSFNPAMNAYYCKQCAINIRSASVRHGDTPFISISDLNPDFTFPRPEVPSSDGAI